MSKAKVKQAVRERDSDKCAECNMSADEHRRRFGTDLELHRLEPGSPYTVAGCVLLCRPCHHLKPRSPWFSKPVQNVKVRRRQYHRLRTIAGGAGMSPSQFLDALLTADLAAECWNLHRHMATAEDICHHVYRRVLDFLMRQARSLTISHPGSGIDVRLSLNRPSDACTGTSPDASEKAPG